MSLTIYERSKYVLQDLGQLTIFRKHIDFLSNKLVKPQASVPFSVARTVEQLGPLYVSASPIHLVTGKPDPVSLLWTISRLGDPLCNLINLFLTRHKAIEIKDWEEAINAQNIDQCKTQILICIKKCETELFWPISELFSISDLYKDDIDGFLKVLTFYEKIISILRDQNIIVKQKNDVAMSSGYSNPSADTNLSKVFMEIVHTEKKYVLDLEKLLEYEKFIYNSNILSNDVIKVLFANLPSLVDFQRRFCICIESLLDSANDESVKLRIGALFVQTESAFSVYDGFCKNYNQAIEVTDKQSEALSKANHILDCSYELQSYLIKPIQRICKFPLLIKEIIKHSKLESGSLVYQEIQLGLVSIKKAADGVNEQRRRQENYADKLDLQQRVEDWKGHDPATFGDLLLHDKFPTLVNDSKRELKVYLFDRIVVFLVDVQNSKVLRAFKQKPNSDKPAFQIKGRIWISNLSDVVEMPDFSLKVFWKSQEMESFTLECRNAEQLKLWKVTLLKLKDRKRKKYSVIDGEYMDDRVKPARPPPPSNFDSFDEIDSRLSLHSRVSDDHSSLPPELPSPISPMRDRILIHPNYQERPQSSSSSSARVQPLDKSGYKYPRKGSAPMARKNIKPPDTLPHVVPIIDPRLAPMVDPRLDNLYGNNIGKIKVRIHTQNEKYALIMDENTLNFSDFYTKIQFKIHLNRFKIKYGYEEKQSIFIMSDEDILNAMYYAQRRENKTLNLFVITDEYF
eukprot:NODE_50_length_27150_cov_0.307308.p1 type:complete len:740 gc:universal NODE_50_length_27150_cov_0.307308:22087-24306(+)